ncbi:MAG: hypothetical protein WBX01_04065 [Nitrososphaeraceae archaeon]
MEAQERGTEELGYTAAQPAHNYGQHPGGAAGWANVPRYRNVCPANGIDNTINHYSPQTIRLYNPPYSSYPTIPHLIGPIGGYINTLILYKELRRCFR